MTTDRPDDRADEQIEAVCNEAVKVIVRVEVEHQGSSPCADKVAYALRDAGLLATPADQDNDAEMELIDRMGKLLTDVANVVNGPPDELMQWSWHDLPERTEKAIQNLLQDKQTITELVTKNRQRAKRAEAEVTKLRAERDRYERIAKLVVADRDRAVAETAALRDAIRALADKVEHRMMATATPSEIRALDGGQS